MTHLEILDKLCESIGTTLERGSAPYIYSAAIYDTWSVGTDLEKNLIDRLVKFWACELENAMTDGYKNTRHAQNAQTITNTLLKVANVRMLTIRDCVLPLI